MSAPLHPGRLAVVESISLASGRHKGPNDGMCVMEAVCFLSAEPYSDTPNCACAVIATFVTLWNDALDRQPQRRNELLKPLVPLLARSRSTATPELRRRYLALDWLTRTYTPSWLELVPCCSDIAAYLRVVDRRPPLKVVSVAPNADTGKLIRKVIHEIEAIEPKVETTFSPLVNSAGCMAAWGAASIARRNEAPTILALEEPAREAYKAAWSAACLAIALTDAHTAETIAERLQQSALDLVHRMLSQE